MEKWGYLGDVIQASAAFSPLATRARCFRCVPHVGSVLSPVVAGPTNVDMLIGRAHPPAQLGVRPGARDCRRCADRQDMPPVLLGYRENFKMASDSADVSMVKL